MSVPQSLNLVHPGANLTQVILKCFVPQPCGNERIGEGRQGSWEVGHLLITCKQRGPEEAVLPVRVDTPRSLHLQLAGELSSAQIEVATNLLAAADIREPGHREYSLVWQACPLGNVVSARGSPRDGARQEVLSPG